MDENQVPKQESNDIVNSNAISEDIQIQSTQLYTENVVTSVPPIAEVKVEKTAEKVISEEKAISEQLTISNISATKDESKNSNELPINNKKSTILLILLFIFLFAFIMGMPYIHDFMNELQNDDDLAKIGREERKEESKKPALTPDDEKITELICTSPAINDGNYVLIKIQKFYYNTKKQVLRSKITSKYDFSVIDENYNSLKQQCDEESLKYLTHDGYTMACSYGDTNIEISHEFDLQTFTPIVNDETNIQANATYQQDINEMKNNLISEGYTCQ